MNTDIVALTAEEEALVHKHEHITVKEAFIEVTGYPTAYTNTSETVNYKTLNGQQIKKEVIHRHMSSLQMNFEIEYRARQDKVNVIKSDFGPPKYPRYWVIDQIRDILKEYLGLVY